MELKNQKYVLKEYEKISFCHSRGVKTIKTITPMIELAKRKCLIVSDSDQTARQYQKDYKKEKGFGKWKTYQDIDSGIKAITAEDFIKNEFISEQINKTLSIRKNFSKELLPEKNMLLAHCFSL